MMSEEHSKTFDLDKVVQILKDEHGVTAYVEQTGGGTATICAEPLVKDAAGDLRYSAQAGPGWFEGPGWTLGRAASGEFCVGPDDDGDGEYVITDETWTEETIAVEVARVVES